MTQKKNDFLLELLAFQQDGDMSIVGKSSWSKNHPLEVETNKTKSAKEVADTLLHAEDPLWQFYIGSPGNGKSHLVGIIFKKLKEAGWSCDELDESKTSYKYTWKRPGEKFSSVWFIQDASSVKDAYSDRSDASVDLANELEEASKKGISIVVCANRGILERVIQTSTFKESETWATSLEHLLNGEGKDFTSGEVKIKVKVEALDAESLVGPDSKILSEILDKTINEPRWSACEDCNYSKRCPLYANKESLKNKQNQERLMSLIRHSEILSGQIMVFRELLALNSLLFAGTSTDYIDKHPCDWVRERQDSSNLISLLSKRFYYVLFSFKEPAGLERIENLRKKQLSDLTELLVFYHSKNLSNETLDSFLSTALPSTEYGIERFLGDGGTLQSLDPIKAGLEDSFLNEWSVDSEEIKNRLSQINEDFTSIEKDSISFWKDIIEFVEKSNFELSSQTAYLIERWSSAFLLRMGGFYSDKTWMKEDLDDFNSILHIFNPDNDDNQKQSTKRKVQSELQNIISKLSDLPESNDGVRISESLVVSGEGITDLVKVHLENTTQPPHLYLTCSFGQRDGSDFNLDGLKYVWLKRVLDDKLVGRSLPQSFFESVLQARSRSVAKSQYTRNRENFLNYQVTTLDKNLIKASSEDVEFWIEDEE